MVNLFHARSKPTMTKNNKRPPKLSLRLHEKIKVWRGEMLLGTLWLAKVLCKPHVLRKNYWAVLIHLVRKTDLFDRDYYLETNVDVAQDKMSSLRHYVAYGDREGRLPLPVFDPHYYRSRIQGRTKHVNALLHYFYVGRYKRISPSPWFNVQYYLSQNKDVARSGYEPIHHYLKFGGLEGRSPNSQFDSSYYLRSYPDVRDAGLNPLLHYIYLGRQEGRLIRAPSVIHETVEGDESLPSIFMSLVGDWNQLEDRIAHNGSIPLVDVIVPVYKNRTLTWRCLSSILTARNHIPFELIVIDDCSPEPEMKADLMEMARRGWITLLNNDCNQGFVSTVNKGISQHPGRDVVLLNSDTEVYDGWLDRLHKSAYKAEKTASVTPLSNNATICSYPRFLLDNPNPLEINYPTLDRLVAQANANVTVEAPTGVGFCMYMRRAALETVGIFNEVNFGKGYGEENDWCQRAIKLGWRNLIAADVFVRHIGGASFLGEKGKRVANAIKVLAKIHPTYESQVQNFITADPLLDARQRLDWARLRHQTRLENVLMVCHNRGGGTEKHLQEDALRFSKEGLGIFYMRPFKGRPSHVRIQQHTCRQLLNLPSFRLSDTKELSKVLRELRITLIHCHGLVDFEPEAPLHLLQLSQTIGAKLHVDIHDYKVICPRINLVDENGRYCGEPPASICNVCLAKRGNDFGVTDISQWRERHHQVLGAAEKVWVPSKDVAVRLNRFYPDVFFTVAAHDDITFKDIEHKIPQLSSDEELRILIIGAIGKMKGFDVVRACAQDTKQRNLPLQFLIMGHTINDRLLINEGVQITGMYQEDEAMELLESLNIHVVFLPSLWPETYSYTLSIALKAGLPIFAFNLGAIAERLKDLNLADHLQPISRANRPRQLNKQFMAYRAAHLIDTSCPVSLSERCDI